MNDRLLTVVTERPARPAHRRADDACSVRELDRVEVSAPVCGDDGEAIPAGSVGTVVGIWSQGRAFEVEFSQPVDALATVPGDLVRVVERAAD